jgi:hypothetical protein
MFESITVRRVDTCNAMATPIEAHHRHCSFFIAVWASATRCGLWLASPSQNDVYGPARTATTTAAHIPRLPGKFGRRNSLASPPNDECVRRVIGLWPRRCDDAIQMMPKDSSNRHPSTVNGFVKQCECSSCSFLLSAHYCTYRTNTTTTRPAAVDRLLHS